MIWCDLFGNNISHCKLYFRVIRSGNSISIKHKIKLLILSYLLTNLTKFKHNYVVATHTNRRLMRVLFLMAKLIINFCGKATRS
jgi:hypothetical protein